MGAIQLSAKAKKAMGDLHLKTIEAWGAEGRPGEYFAATPSVEQTLELKIIEDGNPFLNKINILPVDQVKGEAIGLGLTTPVTSRTDTTGNAERVAKELVALDTDSYECYQTNTDVALSYAKIDAWAKFPDFVAKYGLAVRQAIGNDRLRIGWHGTSAVATSDMVANPNLEDMNKGWLQKIKEFNTGSQHVAGTGPAPIALGSTLFPNLDSVVYAAVDKLKEPFRSDPGLVVLVSRNLMSAAEGKYYSAHGNQPTEKKEIELGIVINTYGGLPALVPPFMPNGNVLVTTLDNLSIYYQSGSWRRMQRDYAPKNRYEDFNSRNEAYVIEEYGKCFLLSNVTISVA